MHSPEQFLSSSIIHLIWLFKEKEKSKKKLKVNSRLWGQRHCLCNFTNIKQKCVTARPISRPSLHWPIFVPKLASVFNPQITTKVFTLQIGDPKGAIENCEIWKKNWPPFFFYKPILYFLYQSTGWLSTKFQLLHLTCQHPSLQANVLNPPTSDLTIRTLILLTMNIRIEEGN